MRVEFKQDAVIDPADPAKTLLEMSLECGIPHWHACGGNARCSTCRVMVLEGLENVLPRNTAEEALAHRKGLEENIRLACQTRVTGPVTVRRLVIDKDDVEMAIAHSGITSGKEKQLAVLFSDIRDFTPFAEKSLPYDAIHILNRYFHKMGDAVLERNGYIDKYIGDGLMALFGVEGEDPAVACENAVLAGLDMVAALDSLNQYLQAQFGTLIRIGVGIHMGNLILGEVGHPKKMHISVIGDTVNMASRIEAATKGAGAALLISETVYDRVKEKVQIRRKLDSELKGKSGTYALYEVVGISAEWVATLGAGDLAVRLRRALRHLMSRSDAPMFLRLAFHDAVSLNAKTGAGCADGSIHFPEELAFDHNRGLQRGVEMLEDIKRRAPQLSWADIIATAGAVAVEKCGGPVISIPLGRLDALQPDVEPYIPGRESHARSLKEHFLRLGLSAREMVALTGAHTIGKADNKPFTEDPFSFTNSYFKMLLQAERSDLSRLRSDAALLEDPGCRPWVETYAKDPDAFLRDFAEGYVRMTILGTNLASDR